MFISRNFLVNNYGVDEEIARFFVNREPPKNNLYWHQKLLYLRPAPGYLFIPLIVDLLHRVGLRKDELLSNRFIETMERVGHISALEETGQISADVAFHQCSTLVSECSNTEWYNHLVSYIGRNTDNFFLRLTTPFHALRRGDYFLFSLCTLNIATELMEKVAEQWFALIGTLLTMDDANDIEIDLQAGDDNAFIEAGLNRSGVQKIVDMVGQYIQAIEPLNLIMADRLNDQFLSIIQSERISAFLATS